MVNLLAKGKATLKAPTALPVDLVAATATIEGPLAEIAAGQAAVEDAKMHVAMGQRRAAEQELARLQSTLPEINPGPVPLAMISAAMEKVSACKEAELIAARAHNAGLRRKAAGAAAAIEAGGKLAALLEIATVDAKEQLTTQAMEGLAVAISALRALGILDGAQYSVGSKAMKLPGRAHGTFASDFATLPEHEAVLDTFGPAFAARDRALSNSVYDASAAASGLPAA